MCIVKLCFAYLVKQPGVVLQQLCGGGSQHLCQIALLVELVYLHTCQATVGLNKANAYKLSLATSPELAIDAHPRLFFQTNQVGFYQGFSPELGGLEFRLGNNQGL